MTSSNNKGGSPAAIKVLLVEDNPGDARLVRDFLATDHSEFEVQHEKRLEDAIRRMEETRFDILLLDLGLPDCRGVETLERAGAAAGDLPIIVFTGHDDDETILSTIRQGARDYFVKSRLRREALVEAIRREVARARQIRQEASQ